MYVSSTGMRGVLSARLHQRTPARLGHDSRTSTILPILDASWMKGRVSAAFAPAGPVGTTR